MPTHTPEQDIQALIKALEVAINQLEEAYDYNETDLAILEKLRTVIYKYKKAYKLNLFGS